MKKIIYGPLVLLWLITSCSEQSQKQETSTSSPSSMYGEKKEIGDPLLNKGVGPISHIELAEINQEMVEEGKNLFDAKCSACHKPTEKFIGPAPLGIMERRSPEWIMNMILNPEVMVKEDPIAKELLSQYLSPMANQNLTEDEARLILEYFRTL